MDSNVVHLPRPANTRPRPLPLALFVRVGRNDHREVLDLIASGEQGIFGFVIEGQHATRHRELITEARRRNFDVVLDPKTQPLGLPGGHTSSLAELPWALDRHHTIRDFEGGAGLRRAEQIVEFAVHHQFTQILGPSHLLSGPNDPWLRRDIEMMRWTADSIRANGANIQLIYSFAVPMDVLRRRPEREALIAAVADSACNAVWLKVENFGDDATGEKTTAYIDACRDFHALHLPLIGDHIGGLPGLAALAFGAVGGISHGITVHQSFKAGNWRRPPSTAHGGVVWRIYVPQLDILLTPAKAQILLSANARMRSRFGCRDTHCCPRGIRDMVGHPARHAVYQRARELEWLSETPQTIRVARFIEERVRRVSDDVASVAALAGLDETLQKTLRRKQGEMSRFRQTMIHLMETRTSESFATAPPRRGANGWV